MIQIKDVNFLVRLCGNIYIKLFARPLFYNFNKMVVYLGMKGLGILNYENFNISGEKKIVDNYILNNQDNKVIFDVGANAGAWSCYIHNHCSHFQIHAFEPNKYLADNLKNLNPKLIVNQCAVGCENGHIDMYDYQGNDNSSHASAVSGVIEIVHNQASKKYSVPIVSLDDYCQKNEIKSINFLKIDVEGFELDVLQGAQNLIKNKNIKLIQFEFNEMTSLRGHHFLDFWKLLSNHYNLYRVLPNDLLPITRYQSLWTEFYGFQNIFAELKN